jgi:hypothetical protein
MDTKGADEVSIHIDKKLYKVPSGSMTASQIRGLTSPVLGDDYDLYQVVPGSDDHLVADGESIDLKSGMHFFSAPRNITPGR